MSSTLRLRRFLLLMLSALALAAGCGSDTGGERVAKVGNRATTALPSTGFVPYPVRVDASGVPVLVNGEPQPAWDGSLADLLAADALALCGATFLDGSHWIFDGYLQYLTNTMDQAICEPSGPLPGTVLERWRTQRTELSECNVDTQKLSPATIANDVVDEPRYTLPAAQLQTVLQGTSSDVQGAIVEAQAEVRVAQVNLCMALKLRQSMISADVLVASGRDQLQLLEVIRERAQIASHYFALFGLVFSHPNPGPNQVLVPQTYLPVLRAWASIGDDGDFRELGTDFAQAINLHIDTTGELARLLLRRAGANADDSDLTLVPRPNATRADREWGAGAWRNRLHNLLYGGDPLGSGWTEEGTGEPSVFPWGGRGGIPTKPYAREDVQSPEVDLLAGLARAADSYWVPSWRSADDTTDFVYRDVDAYLNEQKCQKETPQAPCAFTVADVPTLADFEQSLLWKQHRVTPEHAGSLARMLVEAVPDLGSYIAPGVGALKDKHGAFHVVGNHETASNPPGVTPTGQDWFHFDPEFSIVPFDTGTYASAFTNREFSSSVFGHGVGIPRELSLFAAGRVQGFVARSGGFLFPGTHANALRHTGAVSALTSVRNALLTGATTSQTSSSAAQAYYEVPLSAVGAISASVGRTSMTLEPRRDFEWLIGACPDFPFGSTQCLSPIHRKEVRDFVSEVTVTLPHGSPVPELVAYNLDNDAWDRGVQTSAAFHTDFRSLLGFHRGLLDTAPAQQLTSSETHPDLSLDRHTYQVKWIGENNWLNSRLQYPTLLLRFQDQGGLKYLVLADSLEVQSTWLGERLQTTGEDAWRAGAPKSLAYGGNFGYLSQRARAIISNNWSWPAYDGFGLPRGWVPPSSPELIGAAPGEDSVGYYLRVARTAAQEATQAVEGAVENLIAEEADQELQSASELKAGVVPELQLQALCGDASAEVCKVSAKELVTPDANITCTSDFCDEADSVVAELVPPTVRVSGPVAATVAFSAGPAFSQFSGGALQPALIEEWTAATGLFNYIKTIGDQVVAMDAKIQAAHAQLAAAEASGEAARIWAAQQCSFDAFIAAFNAGKSFAKGHWSAKFYDDDWDGHTDHWSWSTDTKPSSWSPGPLNQQMATCDAAKNALAPAAEEEQAADAAATAVMLEAFAWLSSYTTQIDTLVGAVALARARVTQLIADAHRSAELAKLDAELLAAGRTRTFGVYRRFHQYDLWRARALLENARRLSATARRAIEARYVVDLSTIHQDEPFVSSPSTWADEVYDFDLDAPAAVGLSVVPGLGDTVYPNKLVDYVRNLESFVQGYAVLRPTAVAKRDSEVLNFLGPDQVNPTEVFENQQVTEQPVLDFDSRGWQFYCATNDTWVPHPAIGEIPAVTRADEACGPGSRPERMRLIFRLDAWGRPYGLESEPPYQARHNARWERFAVNLVGTGIRDCTLAPDPLSCYAESFLRFNLRHITPAWLTNFHTEWRWLNAGTARVEGGKAIAAEEWLDPLVNGWSQPFVAEAARSELLDRPLGGAYELELLVTPDVRLDRIQRVQLLAETTYWVSGE